MTLVPGSRFGPFEIHSQLGAGGMGEVYLARDTRLGRDVAIKVLPAAFVSDADRLARFEREARMLAALNHPRIAAIYGVEEFEGTRAIVLELVDGETLEQRLRRQGALSARDAFVIARQIAEALDAAHDKGMAHRDLKPANVKLTSDGDVKVLDFGLAKTVADTGALDADSATMTGTRQGVIVGTAAYMSPEQASGQIVDKRTDVWAFGCVVYEMLTGRPPFTGESVSDTIAKVLNSEPDWTLLPAATAPGVRHLLKRCLERDPKRRLRGLGDIELALDAQPTVITNDGWRRAAVAATAGLLVIIVAGSIVVSRSRAQPAADAPTPIQFEIPASISPGESGAFAISPDSLRIAFIGTGADGVMRMWQRSLDSIETRPIAGTEGEVAANSSIFWSPDSKTIGFYADGAVRKIDRDGGTPQVVCRVPGIAVGGSWNRQGVIVLGSPTGLFRCAADGGQPAALTESKSEGGTTIHFFPEFLPDDRHVLFLRVSRAEPAGNGLYIADLNLPPDQQSKVRVVETGFGGQYVGDQRDGRILFAKGRALFAIPFSPERTAVTGEAVQLASPIATFRDSALFDSSPNILVYRAAAPDYQLTWRGRGGEVLGTVGEPGQFLGVALSPDDSRAAVVRENRLNRSDQDMWLIDLRRNTTVRFTSDALPESMPAWSQHGDALIFAVGHDAAAIWRKPIDGAASELLLQGATTGEFRINPLLSTMTVTGDGRVLIFSVDTRTTRRSDIWSLPLKSGAKAAPLLQQEHDQRQASVSPDGHWLAYVSNESGTNEVFVRSMTFQPGTDVPVLAGAVLISQRGGHAPRWRADGKELFYQSGAGQVMASPVSSTEIGVPHELFQAPGALSEWGVSRDGERFLLAMPAGQSAPTSYSVILNWQSTLSR